MDLLPAWVPVSDPFDLAALVAGFASVLLLIRQNVWTWPVGIVYTVCAAVVFWRHGLYFSLGLHGVFLLLNIYGWWSWRAADVPVQRDDDQRLSVTRSAPALLVLLVVVALLAAAGAGQLMALGTDAQWPHVDATGSALSCVALWLSARKKLESWWFWLVIDVLYAGLYFVTSAPFLGVLYLIYVPLAVTGFLAWRRSEAMTRAALRGRP